MACITTIYSTRLWQLESLGISTIWKPERVVNIFPQGSLLQVYEPITPTCILILKAPIFVKACPVTMQRCEVQTKLLRSRFPTLQRSVLALLFITRFVLCQGCSQCVSPRGCLTSNGAMPCLPWLTDTTLVLCGSLVL